MELRSNLEKQERCVSCTFIHSDHRLGILFESKSAHKNHQNHQAHLLFNGCNGVEHKQISSGILVSNHTYTMADSQSFLASSNHLLSDL